MKVCQNMALSYKNRLQYTALSQSKKDNF